MQDVTAIGYAGKILRVDLSGQKIGSDELDQKTVEKWVGPRNRRTPCRDPKCTGFI